MTVPDPVSLPVPAVEAGGSPTSRYVGLTFQNQLDNLLALLGQTSEERDLLNPHVVGMAPVSSVPISCQVFLVNLGSGQSAFFKPLAGIQLTRAAEYDQTPQDVLINECAAWLMARSLGSPFSNLVPTCVPACISGNLGTLSAMREGVPHARDPLGNRAQLMQSSFFDALTGQQDRHFDNFCWSERTRRLYLIDHGYAFARPGDFFRASIFLVERHRLGIAALTATESDLLRRILESDDLVNMMGVLPRDREVALRARVEQMLSIGELPLPVSGRW